MNPKYKCCIECGNILPENQESNYCEDCVEALEDEYEDENEHD